MTSNQIITYVNEIKESIDENYSQNTSKNLRCHILEKNQNNNENKVNTDDLQDTVSIYEQQEYYKKIAILKKFQKFSNSLIGVSTFLEKNTTSLVSHDIVYGKI